MTQYYIETDGQVFLIEEDGRLRFPHSPEEIMFPFTIRHKMQVENQEILYCQPHLRQHPEDWWPKDKIPALDRVDPTVRAAVHATLPRVTVKAIIIKDSKILMVQPKRGFNTGRWALPGGFVGYGETPEEALVREVEEETGVPCRITEFLGAESALGTKTSFHWHTFFFAATLTHEDFQPAPDEIESVGWADLSAALDSLVIYHRMREKIRARYS